MGKIYYIMGKSSSGKDHYSGRSRRAADASDSDALHDQTEDGKVKEKASNTIL